MRRWSAYLCRRAGDGGRADAVLSGGDVLFYGGTKCEQAFLGKRRKKDFGDDVFVPQGVSGAALTGILPKPNCMIYTNLACDGNMMTFPYLKDKFECPGFYIDVPYEKNRESVLYVADQLRKLKRFLEETTDRRISEETVRSAVDNSRKAAANYKKQLALRCAHDPVTSLTNELYALFMCHLMAGSETAVTYTEKLLRDVQMSSRGDGLSVIWMHTMPFLQEPVKDILIIVKKCTSRL